MKVSELIININEIKSIEVHKVEWVDIQKIPRKYHPVREVSSASITRDAEVLKTKRSLFNTKIIRVKDKVTDYIPLVVLDEVLSYDYSLSFRDSESKFHDEYSFNSIGEHYRELNGSTELTSQYEIKDYKQGSALEKLKEYLSELLVGVDYKLIEEDDKIRLRVGPHMRIKLSDDQIAIFAFKTNAKMLEKLESLSNHSELIRFH